MGVVAHERINMDGSNGVEMINLTGAQTVEEFLASPHFTLTSPLLLMWTNEDMIATRLIGFTIPQLPVTLVALS